MNTSRPAVLSGLAVVVALALGGCGTDETIAIDPAGSTLPTPTLTPTEEPSVGTYPSFEAPNYTFTVETSCFCAGTGPVRITVVDGSVADAEMVHPKRDGAEVPDFRLMTINDVIDAANNTEADQVDVDWPSGQAWPNSVYVDQDSMAIDEEIGYTVSDVVIS